MTEKISRFQSRVPSRQQSLDTLNLSAGRDREGWHVCNPDRRPAVRVHSRVLHRDRDRGCEPTAWLKLTILVRMGSRRRQVSSAYRAGSGRRCRRLADGISVLTIGGPASEPMAGLLERMEMPHPPLAASPNHWWAEGPTPMAAPRVVQHRQANQP